MRLEVCGVTLYDLGMINLRGSWAARELGCLDVEAELLSSSAKCFETAPGSQTSGGQCWSSHIPAWRNQQAQGGASTRQRDC